MKEIYSVGVNNEIKVVMKCNKWRSVLGSYFL